MVVPFLRAEDREERDKLAEKTTHSVPQVSRGSYETTKSRRQKSTGIACHPLEFREQGGYPIPIDADRYVVHLLIPWWLRQSKIRLPM